MFANASGDCLLVAAFALLDAGSDSEDPWLHTVNTEDETTHSAMVSPVQEGERLLAVVARCAQVVWHLQCCPVSDWGGLHSRMPLCLCVATSLNHLKMRR